ncbi:diguanylate cyclase [Vibrio mimicus]
MKRIRLLACRWLQMCTAIMLLLSSSAYAVVEHISDYFVETWTSTDGLPHNSINSVAQTRDGYLWFATWEGVVRYNGLNFQLFDRSPQTGMEDSGTRTLLPMGNNGLLVGGARGSLTQRLSYGWLSFRSAPSLVNGALIDEKQNLWLAIEGLGVMMRPYIGDGQYGPDRWLLTDVSAYRLVKNKQGVVFAATDKGLYQFDDQQPSVVELPKGRYQRINYISISLNQELVVATDHGVWVGSVQRGLLLWQNGSLSPILGEKDGLPSNEVRAIIEDEQGNLWIGTSDGIVKRSVQGELTTYNKSNSRLPDNYIMALAIDEKRRLWVGSAVGVAYFDDQGQIHPVDLTKMEQAQYVFGFYMEADYVWMATDRGIVRYRLSDGMTSLVGRAAGLPIDKFFQMLRDNEGHAWLSSNRGVWKLNYDQMLAVADGMSTLLEFEHFDEGDGMATSQANGGTNPAAASLPSGELYFATAKGVASIKVKRLQQLSELRLPVVLESVSFDSENINPEQQQIAEAGTNRVSFGYVGLGFVMSERLQYRTKLEGFDEDWSYRGHNTLAEYTNLEPGNYRFFVSARYPYGKWNDATYSYSFTIAPHFWQRKEVIFMLGMLVVALCISVVMWRIRTLKRREWYLVEQVALQTQKLRFQAEKFERLSKEDELTGLANRRAFDVYLKQAFSRVDHPGQQVSIGLLDIDHFKQINDRYSHIIGDQAIVAVSQQLLKYVRDKTRVARWGGEEFTILYVGDPKEAWSYFEELRCTIEQVDFSTVAPGLSVTVSVGFADSQQAESYESVLKLADHALLTAKKLGRNRVVKSETWQIENGLN